MNREIKFRIYSKIRNMMLYSDEAPTLSQFFMGKELAQELGQPIVLLQFTGLKDKNGKEIYEGDVVILPDTESHSVDVGIGPSLKVAETLVNTIAVIKFINGGFVFEVSEGGEIWEKGITSFHTTDYTKYKTLDNSDLEKEIEIIGNIYGNPELLKTNSYETTTP